MTDQNMPGPQQDAVGRGFERVASTDGRPVSEQERDANVAVVRQFVQRGLGQGDMAAFDELVAEDVYVSTGLKPGAPINGRAEYKDVVAKTLAVALRGDNAAMTFLEVSPLADGRVVVRFSVQADHVGVLNGVPATNRRLTLNEIHLMTVQDGRIVENLVGALNPLQWEMIYREQVAEDVLV